MDNEQRAERAPATIRLTGKEHQMLYDLFVPSPALSPRWLLVFAAYFVGLPLLIMAAAVPDIGTLWARPLAGGAAFAGLVVLLGAVGFIRMQFRRGRPALVLAMDAVLFLAFWTALLVANAGRFHPGPVYLAFYVFFFVLILYVSVAVRLRLAWKLHRLPDDARRVLVNGFQSGAPPEA